MHILDYRCTDENGLSFVLLVDGQALGELIGARDSAIPYWIINNDLPHLPPSEEEADPEIRIVTVCSCGEYGCGHTRCRVVAEGDTVTFRDFDLDVDAVGRGRVFQFSRSNYESVVSDIARRARREADLA